MGTFPGISLKNSGSKVCYPNRGFPRIPFFFATALPPAHLHPLLHPHGRLRLSSWSLRCLLPIRWPLRRDVPRPAQERAASSLGALRGSCSGAGDAGDGSSRFYEGYQFGQWHRWGLLRLALLTLADAVLPGEGHTSLGHTNDEPLVAGEDWEQDEVAVGADADALRGSPDPDVYRRFRSWAVVLPRLL